MRQFGRTTPAGSLSVSQGRMMSNADWSWKPGPNDVTPEIAKQQRFQEQERLKRERKKMRREARKAAAEAKPRYREWLPADCIRHLRDI